RHAGGAARSGGCVIAMRRGVGAWTLEVGGALLAVMLASASFAQSAAASGKRPAVDVQAMHEAMSSSMGEEEQFSSSASYAHFLRAKLAAHDGDHKRSVDELRLALASD